MVVGRTQGDYSVAQCLLPSKVSINIYNYHYNSHPVFFFSSGTSLSVESICISS